MEGTKCICMYVYSLYTYTHARTYLKTHPTALVSCQLKYLTLYWKTTSLKSRKGTFQTEKNR